MKKIIKVLTASAACLGIIATTAVAATACSSQTTSSIHKSSSSQTNSSTTKTQSNNQQPAVTGSSGSINKIPVANKPSQSEPTRSVNNNQNKKAIVGNNNGSQKTSTSVPAAKPQASSSGVSGSENSGSQPSSVPTTKSPSTNTSSPTPNSQQAPLSKPNKVASTKPVVTPPVITPQPKALGEPIAYSSGNTPVLKITANNKTMNVIINNRMMMNITTGNFGNQEMCLNNSNANLFAMGLVNNGTNSNAPELYGGSDTFSNDFAIFFSHIPIKNGAILIVSANNAVSGNGFNLSNYAINGYVYLEFTPKGLLPIQPVTQITNVSTYDYNSKDITLSGTSYPNASLCISSNNTLQSKTVQADESGKWTVTFPNNHKANANTIFSVENNSNGVTVYTSLPVLFLYPTLLNRLLFRHCVTDHLITIRH